MAIEFIEATVIDLISSRSRDWVCPHCKVPNLELLPDPEPRASTSSEPLAAESPLASATTTVLDHQNDEDHLVPVHTVNPLTSSQGNTLGLPQPQQPRHPNIGTNMPSPPNPSFVVVGEETSMQRHRRPLVLVDTTIWLLVALAAALIYRKIM